MPTALNLEIPSWRVEQIVARTVTLEPASTVTIPSSGPLPEEAHGWLPYRARELQGVTLDVDSGLAFANDLVVAQSGSGTRASRDAAFVSGATVRIKSQRPTILYSPIAPVGDVHHHYHVMLETLPRMLHARSTNPNVKFLTTATIPDRYMNLFHELDLTIEHRDTGDVVIGNPLVLVDQPDLFWPRAADVDILSHIATTNEDDAPGPYQRIYLQRGSAFRQPSNESELESLLTEHGFRSVDLGGMRVLDQLILVSKAQTVVAPHGASLSSISALPAGRRVLELSSGEGFEPCYRRLATLRKLQYQFLALTGSESREYGDARGAFSLILKDL